MRSFSVRVNMKGTDVQILGSHLEEWQSAYNLMLYFFNEDS